MEKCSWMAKLVFIISPNKTILSWTDHHLPQPAGQHYEHLLHHQGQHNQTESSTSE